MIQEVENIKKKLTDSGLKATIQRMIVLEAIMNMRTHPTAEELYNVIKTKHPTISLSTIYNTLESFVEKNIISTVKTDKGTLRYDAFLDSHHHLYCDDQKIIADFYSNELDALLEDFFKRNEIPNFNVKEVKLQIKGNFINNSIGEQNERS